MLFTPELIPEILNRHKRQTRRLFKFWTPYGGTEKIAVPCPYKIGYEYGVQPGRGKIQIARILIVDRREEHLQKISDEDLLMEGIDFTYIGADQKEIRRNTFVQLWNKLNKQRGSRWEDNPLVWVLTFELVDVK
jgi:hypothetical protein